VIYQSNKQSLLPFALHSLQGHFSGRRREIRTKKEERERKENKEGEWRMEEELKDKHQPPLDSRRRLRCQPSPFNPSESTQETPSLSLHGSIVSTGSSGGWTMDVLRTIP
jgi:hypothetical protein